MKFVYSIKIIRFLAYGYETFFCISENVALVMIRNTFLDSCETKGRMKYESRYDETYESRIY